MKVKILNFYNSIDKLNCPRPQDEIYLPIQTGKVLSDINLGIQGDDTGDNISNKNNKFAEFTGLYWAWKNLKNVDIIGTSHYRRYFDYHNQCTRLFSYGHISCEDFKKFDLSIPPKIIKQVWEKGKIVVQRPMYFDVPIVYTYHSFHISDHIYILQDIIRESNNQKLKEAYYECFYKRTWFYPCILFLMRWEDFENFCEFIFPILDKLDKRIDITHLPPKQERALAFMAERLFNVWLFMNNKKVIPRTVALVGDSSYRYAWFRHVGIKLRSKLLQAIFNAKLPGVYRGI